MKLYPSIDKLLDQVNSKYSMVIVSAKRAHELHDKAEPLLDEYKSISHVGKALEEIVSGDLVLDPDSVDRTVL